MRSILVPELPWQKGGTVPATVLSKYTEDKCIITLRLLLGRYYETIPLSTRELLIMELAGRVEVEEKDERGGTKMVKDRIIDHLQTILAEALEAWGDALFDGSEGEEERDGGENSVVDGAVVENRDPAGAAD